MKYFYETTFAISILLLALIFYATSSSKDPPTCTSLGGRRVLTYIEPLNIDGIITPTPFYRCWYGQEVRKRKRKVDV